MKLVLEFTKTGNLINISHLDLSRLFLRVLRMAGLRPVYSQGFNPHPKMSMALPLSLGLHSLCEVLEFETAEAAGKAGTERAFGVVNERLPEGIRVTAWREKPETVSKSLASLVKAASYEIMCEGIHDAPELLKLFFASESVAVRKPDKKTGAESEKEIRGEMLGYRIVKNMRGRMLAEVTLSALPGHTLNPVVFFDAFCEASGLESRAFSPVITRTAILGAAEKPLTELLEPEEF